MPLVLLINGISATGKTTIGRKLADALRLPFYAKDAIKERLFDTVGFSDRAWSHRLSGATHTVINYVLEEELKCGRGFVLESNFNPQFDLPKFERWHSLYDFSIVQVLCHARGDVVFERFRQRVESGERHPGHADHESLEAWRGYLMSGRCDPLPLPGKVIEVDTTDFDAVDIESLVVQIGRQ